MDSDSLEHSSSPIVGIRPLFAEGYALFRQLLKPLLAVNGILVGAYVIFGILVGIEVVIGTFASESGTAPILLIAILVLLGIAETIALLFIVMWIILTLQSVIRSKDPAVRIRDAFKATRSLVWPFIWMNVLVGLITFGLIIGGEIVVFVLVALAALAHSVVATIAVTAVGFIAIAAAYVMLLTAFGFSNWTFLAEDARGTKALRASRDLSRGRFWPVFGRLSVLGIAYIVLAIILFAVVLGLQRVAGTAGYAIGEIINVAVSFIILPLFLACHFVLYESLRSR